LHKDLVVVDGAIEPCGCHRAALTFALSGKQKKGIKVAFATSMPFGEAIENIRGRSVDQRLALLLN